MREQSFLGSGAPDLPCYGLLGIDRATYSDSSSIIDTVANSHSRAEREEVR